MMTHYLQTAMTLQLLAVLTHHLQTVMINYLQTAFTHHLQMMTSQRLQMAITHHVQAGDLVATPAMAHHLHKMMTTACR